MAVAAGEWWGHHRRLSARRVFHLGMNMLFICVWFGAEQRLAKPGVALYRLR
jgi:hypothetical protein